MKRWLPVVAVAGCLLALGPITWAMVRALRASSQHANDLPAPVAAASSVAGVPNTEPGAPVGTSIEGRVHDPEGAPVAAALVRAVSEAPTAADVAVTRTEIGGRFRMESLRASSYAVQVIAEGMRRTTHLHVVPGAHDLELVLTPTTRILGQVVDHDTGKPVERFRLGGEWIEGTGGTFEYQLSDFRRDPIELRADGYVPLSLDPTDQGEELRVHAYTFELRRGTKVLGRVIAGGGAGVENVHISALARGAHPYRAEAMTSPDGRFQLTGLDDQPWLLTAREDAPEHRVGTVSIRPYDRNSDEELVLQLGKQGALVDLLTPDITADLGLESGVRTTEEWQANGARLAATARVIAEGMTAVIADRARSGADPDAYDDLLEAAAAAIPAEARTPEVERALADLRRARDRSRAD